MEGCVFCSVVAGDTPAHVVLATPEVVAFLDRSPLFRGHVLVVPRTHVATLPELPDELLVPFFRAVRSISAVMPGALDAHGSFVAMNNVVSQSVPHLHAHVVPRRRKDGLRGFFWPRVKYASDAEAVEYATRLRVAIAGH